MPTTDLILYQFSRDRVEAGDAKDFLSSFGKSSLPTGKKLESMMNSVALMIDGYNHDLREIYAIPEVILASWITKAKADEPLDTLTPLCESYEREEVVVIGQAPQGNITHLLPIHRLDNGKFWYLGDAVDMPADGFEGRFAGLFSSKPPDEQKRQMGKKLLDAMGVKVSMLKYLRMTKTQINQHIADFEKLVKWHANKISEIGNASRDPIKSTLAAAFSGSL